MFFLYVFFFIAVASASMTQQMEEIDKKNKFLDENGCWVYQKTPKSLKQTTAKKKKAKH